MMKSKQTRFVLALLCALTISSTVFAKDTRYLRRVLTTDEEGTTQDLGKGGKGSNSSKQPKSSKSGKSMKSSKSPKGKGGKGSDSSSVSGKGGKGSKSSRSPGKGGKGKGGKGSTSSKSSGKGSKSIKSMKSSKSSKETTQSPEQTPIPTSAPVGPTNPTASPVKEPTPGDVDPCGEDAIRDALLEITPSGGILDDEAFNWLINEDTMKVCADNLAQLVQRYALAAFYFSTEGRNWNFCSADAEKTECESENERFLSGGSECEWYGVDCCLSSDCVNDSTVKTFKLANFGGQVIGLKGNIAPEIFLMPDIKDVEIGFDDEDNPEKKGGLDGDIPANIGLSNQLRLLDLQNQQISGDIPASFYQSTLREVDLDGNKLTGVISNDVKDMQNLVFWSASGNNFDRQVIPDGFGNIMGLKFFSMRKSKLEGAVPSTFSSLNNMTLMDLSENDLTGTIDFLENYNNLEGLALSNNKFSGDVPSALWKKTKLTTLILDDNDFTGEISSNINMMVELRTLSLKNNKMSGPIPAEIGELIKLKSLELDGNDFTGSIPQALCDLPGIEPIVIDKNTLNCPVDCCQEV